MTKKAEALKEAEAEVEKLKSHVDSLKTQITDKEKVIEQISSKLQVMSIEKAESMGKQMMTEQQIQQLSQQLNAQLAKNDKDNLYIVELEKLVPKKKLPKRP